MLWFVPEEIACDRHRADEENQEYSEQTALEIDQEINDIAVRKAIIYGSVMASFAVEDFGLNRLLTLKKSEIEKRFDEFKTFTRF